MTKAVTAGDAAHSFTPAFKGKVQRALDIIKEAAQIGRIGVSFSGGKDSTVLLDLVRQVVPDVALAFFDSGCEYAWTYEIVEHYGAAIIHPEMSLPDLCRYGGYWGYEDAVEPGRNIDFDAFLIYEPATRFRDQYKLDVCALGLRGQESFGRMQSAKRSGRLYACKYDGLHHLCPLAFWRTEDIWAYIASRELQYNHAYDRMANAGIPRREWRVSTLLGAVGASFGRLSNLRLVDPNKFIELAREFPELRRMA